MQESIFLTTVLVGLDVGALWSHALGKETALGDMAFQKFGGKVSLNQAPSLAHGPPSPAIAMTISPAFSILTTAMSTLMKIIFLLFLLCHLIMT